ncbi:hypothetical protein AGOR_G00063230 [Albula goreensis]|uniref:LIM zinc-binding domain-containing protein n=1 Tax=Albula goreensis TaxID=1534307 RepID=A0A8T3DVZ4_9TELE|nr:hypothetical protein AGOR_G00063230 [Albula goreensis]
MATWHKAKPSAPSPLIAVQAGTRRIALRRPTNYYRSKMAQPYAKRSYIPKSEVKSGSPSQAIEDSKRKSSLLKDNSWIRKDMDEDEPVDRDPNFGRAVLSRFKSNEKLDSKQPVKDTSTTTSSKTSNPASTSVQSLTKKFGGSQDQLSKTSSPPPSYERATAYSKRSTLPKTTPPEGTTTSVTTKSTVDGKVTETTVTTTSSSARTPVTKRPTKTETFTERVFSDVKSSSKPKPSTLPPKPSKTNGVTDPEVTSSKGTLGVSSTKTTEVTTVTTPKETSEGGALDTLSDTFTTTTTTKTVYSTNDSPKTPEVTTVTTPKETIKDGHLDSLADTLISTPKSSLYSTPDRDYSTTYSTVSSPTSTTTRTSIRTYSSSDYSPTKTSSYSFSTEPSYEYTSVSSPTVYTKTSSYLENRPLDSYSDTIVTKPISTVYSTSDRSIIGKDMCTYCRKPLNSEPKMILEDMQIHCHASCFMCEVCNRSLGHLKAGDSMWIYRRTVHCDRCFEMTREKWHR